MKLHIILLGFLLALFVVACAPATRIGYVPVNPTSPPYVAPTSTPYVPPPTQPALPSPTWTPQPTPWPYITLYICTDAANARSGPGLNYPVLSVGTRGQSVKAYYKVGEWWDIGGRSDTHSDYYIHQSVLCDNPNTQPEPTYAPAPTEAPTVYVPPTPEPSQPRCIDYSVARSYVGYTTCVSGIVTYAGSHSGTFFIDYGDTYRDFYGVSFDHTFSGLYGRCVAISGTIILYRGRPEIIIKNTNQVQYCQ